MVPGHHPEAQVEQLPGRVHPPCPRKRLQQWQISVAAMKGKNDNAMHGSGVSGPACGACGVVLGSSALHQRRATRPDCCAGCCVVYVPHSPKAGLR